MLLVSNTPSMKMSRAYLALFPLLCLMDVCAATRSLKLPTGEKIMLHSSDATSDHHIIYMVQLGKIKPVTLRGFLS